MGESKGVLAQIGDYGWSWIFGIDEASRSRASSGRT